MNKAELRLNTVTMNKIKEVFHDKIKVGDFLRFKTIEEYEDFGEEITDLIEKFEGQMVEVLKVSEDTNEWGEHYYLVVNSEGDIVSATDHEFSKVYREI